MPEAVGGRGVQHLALHCISFLSTARLFHGIPWPMGRDVTGFASDPGCSPESVQPRTLGTCQLFALQLAGLPPFYLALGWRLRVAVPWAAGEGAELCPLDLATLAPAGPMPACPCEPRGS